MPPDTGLHQSPRIVPLLHRAAVTCAGLLLLVIPFRATVGLRGGLLALTVILLLVAYLRNGPNWRECLPRQSLLNAIAVVWLAATLLWALASDSPSHGLHLVRRDVLSPILGFCVFHALTRGFADLARWAWLLFAAQLVLTVMVVLDPFQVDVVAHRPAYIDVGVLSAWLVTVAALVPVFWLAPQATRGEFVVSVASRIASSQIASSRIVAVVLTACILVAAALSANRTLWICFAAMLVAGSLLALRLHADRRRLFVRVVFILAGVTALLALGWASLAIRAAAYPEARSGQVAYLLDDPRRVLWAEGAKMISEKPLAGRGFGSNALKAEFADRTRDNTAHLRFEHAHNVVLNYGMQMGLFGAMLILTLFSALAVVFLRLAGPQAGPLAQTAAICGVALLVGVFLRNMTDDFFLRQSGLLFACLAGMLVGAGSGDVPRQTQTRANHST